MLWNNEMKLKVGVPTCKRGQLYLFSYLLSAQTGHTWASNSANLLHILENASFAHVKKPVFSPCTIPHQHLHVSSGSVIAYHGCSAPDFLTHLAAKVIFPPSVRYHIFTVSRLTVSIRNMHWIIYSFRLIWIEGGEGRGGNFPVGAEEECLSSHPPSWSSQ